ncbi:MAG: hypothetical protein ABIS29_15165 [Vicinamibacterales bacterium]
MLEGEPLAFGHAHEGLGAFTVGNDERALMGDILAYGFPQIVRIDALRNYGSFTGAIPE